MLLCPHRPSEKQAQPSVPGVHVVCWHVASPPQKRDAFAQPPPGRHAHPSSPGAQPGEPQVPSALHVSPASQA